jgi:hypothetical protein
MSSLADVCLISPSKSGIYGGANEFRGLYRILAHAHILFDIVHDSVLDNPDALDHLKKFKVVILPEVRSMSDTCVKVLDQYVQGGGKILATGATATCDEQGHPLNRVQLECSGITAIKRVLDKNQGTYYRIRPQDKEQLNGFEELDIIYLHTEALDCQLGDKSIGYLGYIPPAMFGPPEKCYYTEETDIPGLVLNDYGAGRSAFIPWSIGKHFEKLSNHAHAMLLMSVLEDLLQYQRPLTLEASPLIEVSAHRQQDGEWQSVSLVNLSGQLGTAFLAPLPIRDIKINVNVPQSPKRVFTLRKEQDLDFTDVHDGTLTFTIPELELLETVVIQLR